MSTVDEIEAAIRKLPDDDLATFHAWFAEFDAAAWDRWFEKDVVEGRLDALADEALRDGREGRCTDLGITTRPLRVHPGRSPRSSPGDWGRSGLRLVLDRIA